jgi:hypothetical protein
MKGKMIVKKYNIILHKALCGGAKLKQISGIINPNLAQSPLGSWILLFSFS